MKHLRVQFLILIVFLIACEKLEIDPPTIPTPISAEQQILLDLVNEYRATGCYCGSEFYPAVNPLEWNDTLELAAKIHSEDMDINLFFGHEGSDGSRVRDRIDRLNYPLSTWGENISRGYASEAAAIEAWINSEGHCRNIMYPKFKQMAIASSGKFSTQVFASH